MNNLLNQLETQEALFSHKFEILINSMFFKTEGFERELNETYINESELHTSRFCLLSKISMISLSIL